MADDPAPLMHVQWLRLFEQWRQELKKPLTLNAEQIVAGILDPSHMPALTGFVTTVAGTVATKSASKLIVQGTADANLTGAQFLGALGTGLVKNTTATGVLSIGLAATDYVAPSAYASANGLTMATARLLGRTTAGTGAAEEISIGANLSLSAGVLTGTGASSAITDDTTTNATMFPVWVTANTGLLPLKVSSTKLSFNPSTGMLGTVGLTVSAFTAGSVVFAGTGGLYSQDNAHLFWDDGNNRLGIGDVGTTAPDTALHLVSTAGAGQFKLDRGSGLSHTFNLTAANLLTVELGTTNGSRIWWKARQLDVGSVAPINIGEADAGYPGVAYNVIFGDTVSYTYRAADTAYLIDMGSNSRIGFKTAPAGSAAAAITFTERLTILNTGNVGIGVTAPTAAFHLKAGTTTANTAPLKFNSGSLLTTAEAGAVEFLTDAYYGTITTGAARKTFAFLESPAFTTPNIGVASGTSLALTTSLSLGGNLAASATTPTFTSGFGGATGRSIAGTAFAFTITCGNNGVDTGGVLGMPTAATGWVIFMTNLTNAAAPRSTVVLQTASTTTSVTVSQIDMSTGAVFAFGNGDVLRCHAVAY